MDEKELSELLKYSSPRELLVVDYNNKLTILICPFEVLVKYDLDTLMKHQIVLVEEVKITRDLINVYIIQGKGYYYFHFEILIVEE